MHCRSSVDMHLQSKGLAPSDAFSGKVVWITGASQVEQCRLTTNVV